MAGVANKERRHWRWRVGLTIGLHLAIVAHLVAWYVFDWTVIGAIDMQELFRHLIEQGTLTIGALFFLVLIAASLLWGRLFCGWMCHIGQIYDLTAPYLRKLGMGRFETRLGPLMALFILLFYYLRPSLEARKDVALHVDWNATAPWELLPGPIIGVSVLLLVWVAMPLSMGPRAFCRNLCPWGVLLGLGNKLAPWKVRRSGNCTNCGACGPACPMDIDVSRMINTDFAVKSVACTGCMQCVTACPEDALSFSLPTKTNRAPRDLPLLAQASRVPWWQELAFWTLTLAVGLVYDELYGLGIFMAYVLGTLLAWASIRVASLRKTWMIALIVIAWGIVVKDGMADYHWRAGERSMVVRDVEVAQVHYEKADALFWQSPTVLLYRLYVIYKGTGQEAKRKSIYDRYEARRAERKGD